MDNDEPPTTPEIFFSPSRIVGFNLRRKKWVNLEVDLIKEVEWNKKDFKSLVIDEKTKEIVQALIANLLEAEQGTDMIDDKENGLTILLHGGPGTGKTFTAESVAELAEKLPPENVEHYLKSALHLGKIWDCIVLLDEADVFLQERTLSDFQRNALVTVFLRVLEYYDGILILTSKHRFKIWPNLINRLKRLEQSCIDFDDIECYISHRQLARIKGKGMSNMDVQHVLDVSGRFDKYLCSLKEGFMDDDISSESGLR
ncbi:hypothetical protein BDW59DRAFT_176260 [Aspergillus cavernicola]|uniref:ATPase AAA-type core domain-containing protein n=1 Tax=Aspergillus cavernicola TaxID=176166 RepID=A0ABR4HHR0_9EURO